MNVLSTPINEVTLFSLFNELAQPHLICASCSAKKICIIYPIGINQEGNILSTVARLCSKDELESSSSSNSNSDTETGLCSRSSSSSC
jgi:hypothetical protein